jgi:hypothetical protein
MPDTFTISSLASSRERDIRSSFYETFARSPLPPNEQLNNLGLFISRQSWSRMLFMNELYQQILEVPGVMMEFGVRWGQNLALFANLRGIYEPFNHTRKIIGFDTFEGFPSVDPRDGSASVVVEGSHSVTPDYEDYLAEVLDYHESESPISHLRKYELVKGDVTETLPTYLEEHPETVIAFAYFDLDIYEPTRAGLEAIKPRLTRGSVVAFDELNHPEFPGETTAVMEVLGLDRIRLRRSRLNTFPSYLVVE